MTKRKKAKKKEVKKTTRKKDVYRKMENEELPSLRKGGVFLNCDIQGTRTVVIKDPYEKVGKKQKKIAPTKVWVYGFRGETVKLVPFQHRYSPGDHMISMHRTQFMEALVG